MWKIIPSILFLSVSFFLFVHQASAQQKISSALIKPDSTTIIADSTRLITGTIELIPDVHAKSGKIAMVLSAVLPGAGQVYAHHYYYIPVWWGLGIFFYSQWSKGNSSYHNLRDQYAASVLLDTLSHLGDLELKRVRDDWRDWRDQFAVYLGFTYLINIIDAYVGATLYSFDVSNNLGSGATLRFRIPLH